MTDADILRKAIRCDPEAGKLFWLARSLDMFPGAKLGALHAQRSWNTRFAGKEAFAQMHSNGYLAGGAFRRKYFAHRVIWMFVNGSWPDEIDHINGDKTDNRIVNLRSVSRSENLRNAALKSSNTSGVTGVSWDKRDSKWMAQIRVSGRSKNLGRFANFEDACAARMAANITYGFHENHGRKSA